MTLLNSIMTGSSFHCLPFADFSGEYGVMPYLGLVVPLAFVLCIIFIGALAKAHKEKLQHETIQRALDKGQPLPPELFSQPQMSPEFFKLLAKHPSNDRRGGLIAIAVGIGLYVFFGAMQSEGVPDGLKWLGLIPGLVGVALLINWALDRREKGDQDKP